jgi:hypothetical protein
MDTVEFKYKKDRETGGSKQGMEAKKSCSELKQLLM